MNTWTCSLCHNERHAWVTVEGRVICTVCASAITEAYKSYTQSIVSKAKYYPHRKGDWTP